MRRSRLSAVAVVTLGIWLFGSSAAHGDPTFYLSPGTGTTGDVAWQTAVGGNFIEFDLEGFSNGADVDSLSAGSLTIDIGIGSGLTVSGTTAEIFAGSYTGGGGTNGTVFGNALLNRNSSGGIDQQMIFEFSTPVSGFGLWVFDNASASADAFRMIVEEVGGATFTSGVLDANPGLMAHTVEGWLGATSTTGITSLAIEVGSWDGSNQGSFSPHCICFEVDHIQVVPAPAPRYSACLA